MAKKLVAVTGIKHNGEFVQAGEAIDASKFSKEELKQLHDAGAVKVDGDEDPTPEELAPEKSVNDDQAKPEEKKEEAPKPTTPSTPAKTTTTPAKSTSSK